ncbi:MAG: hypothetical protein KY454_09020 [Actinobacteria bacterium]|nr:hypothetical protein [Actinomycetota bacterium]MBW3651559.1 hypothetical protein [Actinomycetota bacterium]
MLTSLKDRADLSPASLRTGRVGGTCLALAGIAFFAGGVSHPQPTIEGTKVETLYDMFVQPSWYPSHALLLASFALFATAVLLLRKRGDLDPRMAAIVNVVSVLFVVGTLSMAVHLFDALGADSIADGQAGLVSRVATWNETIFSTLWGVGIITLAAVGGLTRTLGNRIIMPLGVVGGLAWCLAAATVAFIDRFDPLFPVAGTLIPVWAVATGAMWALRTK